MLFHPLADLVVIGCCSSLQEPDGLLTRSRRVRLFVENQSPDRVPVKSHAGLAIVLSRSAVLAGWQCCQGGELSLL